MQTKYTTKFIIGVLEKVPGLIEALGNTSQS